MSGLSALHQKTLRSDRLPHIWCQGCGLGIILHAYVDALEESGIDLDKVVTISGIGCAGRTSGYVRTDAFHTTHGRALPFATGVGLSRPDLKPVVISGDGDLFSIGGNHLVHAARRNVNVLVVCSNNFNYGMTGAQFGPTTPVEARTPTSPYGNVEHPLNLVSLVASAGATYVARWTVMHPRQLRASLRRGLMRRGFSFVEVIRPCTTGYGRLNGLTPMEMMRGLRDVGRVRNVTPSEAVCDPGREIILGEFIDMEAPTYDEALDKLTGRGAG